MTTINYPGIRTTILTRFSFVIIFALQLTTLYIPVGAQDNKRTEQKGEVIYHLFQRSFYDSNGDLHGDLNGIRQKLDYLQDLGVTSILLLPLYEANCYHNYFANDFEAIDPEYGTMDDYLALVKDIHKRGMKIYLDMETQYVTEYHAWWKDAVGNPQSQYRNHILFQDEAHTIPSTIIFGLTALNSYDGSTLRITTVNLKSPEVLDYNVKLFRFFADPNGDGKFDDGADGFRLDHAMDNLDKKPELTNLFAEFFSPLITKVKAVNPEIKFIAEQADWMDHGFGYFEKANVDVVFAFGLWYAITSLDKQKIVEQAEIIFGKTPAGKNQVVFIENHDIDRSATVFGQDPGKERAAAALSLLIGGMPSIYYGQELGMTGDGGFGKYGSTDGNDIPYREAFEWYKDGRGNGMALWYRNTGPWWDNAYAKPNDGISFEEQQSDDKSLLNFYKAILKVRKGSAALSTGEYKAVQNDNGKVFSFIRDAGKDKALVVVNLSGEKQTVNLKTDKVKYAALYGKTTIANNRLSLQPYGVGVWAIH